MVFRLAKWDGMVKFGTWFVIIVMLGTGVFVLLPLLPDLHEYFWAVVIWSVLLLFIIITYLLAPRYYLLTRDKLIIRRIIGNIVIDLDEIISVDKVKKPRLWRVVGNGGLFSYYGLFNDEQGNKVKVYSTRLTDMVKIQTKTGTFYLSPQKNAEFIDLLKGRAYV